MLDEDLKNKLLQKNSKVEFDGIILYSREYKTVYELK